MMQFMGSQRARHVLATEQKQSHVVVTNDGSSCFGRTKAVYICKPRYQRIIDVLSYHL